MHSKNMKRYLKFTIPTLIIFLLLIIGLNFFYGRNGFAKLFTLIFTGDLYFYSSVIIISHIPLLLYLLYQFILKISIKTRLIFACIIFIIFTLYVVNYLWESNYKKMLFKNFFDDYQLVIKDNGKKYWQGVSGIECGYVYNEKIEFLNDSTVLSITKSYYQERFSHIFYFLGLINYQIDSTVYNIKNDTLYCFYKSDTLSEYNNYIIKRNFRIEKNELKLGHEIVEHIK